jgi:hypothetical protein
VTATDDRTWQLAAARGEVDSDGALAFVRTAKATLGHWQDRDPELAHALDDGDRDHPADTRRQPGPGDGPQLPTIDVDPATMDAFDRRNGHDGGTVLGEVHQALIRYVAFPSAEAVDAVTLWVAATHAQTAWEHATRLVIKSPVRRCGKTRLLEVAMELCHQVLATTNISVAALTRSIGLVDPPTIMLDEADAVFATRRGERSESAEDLRGILNSGHARGWPYIRWDATTRKREECPTFAMAIVSGIGDMPDTIEDRAVIVTMRRRAPGEQVARFRRRRSVPPLRDLRDRLHDWMVAVADDLAHAEPDLPAEDRAADVWEPLVAVADAAGGDWPQRARNACAFLTGTAADEEADGTRLLADLYSVFGEDEVLSSATILERLNAVETSPWGGWHRGDGLNPRDLAKMLRPYKITPIKVKIAGESVRGYRAEAFHDDWSRYVVAFRQDTRNPRNHRNAPASEVPGVPPVPDNPPSDDDLARYEANSPELYDSTAGTTDATP